MGHRKETQNLKIVVMLLLIMLMSRLCGDVLLWSVNGYATVDGGQSLYAFLNPLPYDDYGDNVYGARVAAYRGGITTPVYINVWFEDEYGNPVLEDGMNEVDIGHPSLGYVGAGWIQSEVSREMLEECMFQIQLGHSIWNYSIDEYEWTTIAMSDTVAGTWLRDSLYTYTEFDMNPPIFSPWEPSIYYAIPEPCGSLLYTCGLLILLLKRNGAYAKKE